MDVFLILTVGALSGFIIAQFVSWFGLLWFGPVLAAISAAILQKHGYAWPSGIAIIVGCLSLNQIGYLLGGLVSGPGRRSTAQATLQRGS
jgi:hypothetical protein